MSKNRPTIARNKTKSSLKWGHFPKKCFKMIFSPLRNRKTSKLVAEKSRVGVSAVSKNVDFPITPPHE